jgi:tricorn protease
VSRLTSVTVGIIAALASLAAAQEDHLGQGYYRQPALHGNTIVFVAEGDLWRVDTTGGAAVRLTTHAASESQPVISPGGDTIAFLGAYEGPTALYTMPVDGGRPVRWTWDSTQVHTVGWSPAGSLIYATSRFSTLPNTQLVELDTATGELHRIPLAQADDGCYDDSSEHLFFTRHAHQGSSTKRYVGGTAQRLWRFSRGAGEAVPLTADYRGTSRDPMWWQGRLYFASDRDGTMNLWSMLPDGSDLVQHTHHVGWDLLSPSLSAGRVVYQLGADLRLLDLASGSDEVVPITLVSDFDHTREHWVEKPIDYLTSVHISPDGDRLVLTARGQVFVAPHRQGRLVAVPVGDGVRHRDARFLADGEKLLSMSDESGEVELWRLPADGVGERQQLTSDGEVLRLQALPSPDGKLVAHIDKNFRLWLHDLEAGTNIEVDRSEIESISDLAWSPDSRWLAYVATADNLNSRIHLYRVDDGLRTIATNDRYHSWSPVFSMDGKWLYLLSERHFRSQVGSPWGRLQPEPYFDKRAKIYMLALQEDLRSPFAADNELDEEPAEKSDTTDTNEKDDADEKEVEVEIVVAGLAERLHEVPVPPANSYLLDANDTTLFWIERDAASGDRRLQAMKIDNQDPKPVTVADKITSYELSLDGKKVLIRMSSSLHIIDAAASKAELDDKSSVDLSHWSLSVMPQQEWRQMLIEAWRLERDHFYDRGMHGTDWQAILDRYLPLIDRVRSRDELADLTAQMVSELCALHIFVGGGDYREGRDSIAIGSLGALLVRDAEAGGDRVEHIYISDPDEPERRSPLAEPGVGVKEGDLITHVDGTPVTAAPQIAALLRTKVGRQVRLRVVSDPAEEPRDVIVTPISQRRATDLRYHEWEYSRRLRVEEAGEGEIGYVHLRAMGARDIAQWARHFYPVHHRQGLIIDVRHNRGGNIESWIIEKLMRKVWAAWSDRIARPSMTNMQYAFRGHLVVLCDAWTMSDGEAFLEAVRRLQLAPIIGIRTWGGGIWLNASNFLVDRGIATAAEYGLFGPEGRWIIEMDGVEPDHEVDNLPHATFNGADAQLEAAIELLKQKIAEHPVPPLEEPSGKDLSLR